MLNDRECKNAKRQEKPYKLPDGNGLYLEVKPNGVKAWRYRFELRQDGVAKESVFAIGTYASPPTPVISSSVTDSVSRNCLSPVMPAALSCL